MLRFVLVLLPVLSGCALMLAPEEDALPPSNLPVEFAVAPLETEFAVAGQTGSIVVHDRTVTGVCHKRENRGAFLEDSVVTLWFAHTGSSRDICPAIAKLGAYRAAIGGLQPGSYTVRVQYIGQIDSDTYPRAQLEQQVTVR